MSIQGLDLELVTPPSGDVVTLSEAKAHLRVDVDDDDVLIQALIDTAVAHLEGRGGVLGRALLTQTWDLRLDGFPADDSYIDLPLPPLQSVGLIEYTDRDGVTQIMATSDYRVNTRTLVGRVTLAPTKVWPETIADDVGVVRIRFTAGYGAASAVPPPIKQAILLLVGPWYQNREAVGQVGQPVALAVEALTAPLRSVIY